MLRPGLVGMRGHTVIGLRPCVTVMAGYVVYVIAAELLWGVSSRTGPAKLSDASCPLQTKTVRISRKPLFCIFSPLSRATFGLSACAVALRIAVTMARASWIRKEVRAPFPCAARFVLHHVQQGRLLWVTRGRVPPLLIHVIRSYRQGGLR